MYLNLNGLQFCVDISELNNTWKAVEISDIKYQIKYQTFIYLFIRLTLHFSFDILELNNILKSVQIFDNIWKNIKHYLFMYKVNYIFQFWHLRIK